MESIYPCIEILTESSLCLLNTALGSPIRGRTIIWSPGINIQINEKILGVSTQFLGCSGDILAATSYLTLATPRPVAL